MATPKKTAKPTNNALTQAKAAVAKVLKDDDPSVSIDANQLRQSRPHLTSGSVVLDYLIGGRPNRFGVAPCPGWPKGMISNIYGHESSGKTTVALQCAAATCAAGGVVAFIDWEHAISPDYAKQIGVPIEDPDRFYLVQPNTLEAGLQVLWACAMAGVDLIVLDSVGAGVPKAIREDQSLAEKGEIGRVGLVAAKWSAFLPQVAGLINKSGTHLMGLSQIRKKINTQGGGHGDDSTHQGGEAWKFYSNVRMTFRRVMSIKTKEYDALKHKNEERFTSALIRAKVVKSKISNSQQAEADFHVIFGEGIDNVRDLIVIGEAHGLVVKAGAWFSAELAGESLRGQGLPDFKSKVLSTKGAYDELVGKVMKSISAPGASALPVHDDDGEGEVDDALAGVSDIGFVTE